jgi:hypothetical protein
MNKERFAIDLTDKCETDDQWFSVMQFGMATLLQDSPLLFECIVRRAQKIIDTTAMSCTHNVADMSRDLMQKLNLKFEVI